MADRPLNPGILVRTGVVWPPDTGYLLACDPATEDADPHAFLYRWHRGGWSDTWMKFNAHALGRVTAPDDAVVALAHDGLYATHSRAGAHYGSVHQESGPRPAEPRYGDFRGLGVVAGRAYAVGLRGMVYRLARLDWWERIDDPAQATFDAQAVAGWGDRDLYVVGSRGGLWHYGPAGWARHDLPTNLNLTAVACDEDAVYVGGHKGTLFRGRGDRWELIPQEDTEADIWGVAWVGRRLYVSTFAGLFRLAGTSLEPVDFGPDPPKTTYTLSAAGSHLWSVGESDVMAFDGTQWSRIL